MTLQKKIKELLVDQKGVLADNEIVAINRRDYYMGEAGPIDGFFSAFDGLRAIKNYQDLEILNTSVVLAEMMAINKNVKIVNTVDSTLVHSVYLYTALESSKLINKVTYKSKVKAITEVTGKNKWAKSIVESLNINNDIDQEEKRKTKNNSKDVEIIFTDALNGIEYEEATLEFERSTLASILIVRNGTHIDAKLKSNPYSRRGIRTIFDVCGSIINVKFKNNNLSHK